MTPKYAFALAGLISAATAAAAIGGGISAISWGPQRIDVFGLDSKRDVFHKYYTAFGWGPSDAAHGDLELFTNANASDSSAVSSLTWGPNRMDFFFVDKNTTARHKYWDGSSWGPSAMNGYDVLGTGVKGKLAVSSWGENRFDVVGRSIYDTYVHKAWTGREYYPPAAAWEDFPGTFISDPATVSWGPNRLDIFGLNEAGDVLHKFWDGHGWIPSFEKWENLGGKGFNGTLTVSSPAEGRFDIWAISNSTHELHHLFWDGYAYRGWENLGGHLTAAPQVIHWSPTRIDIVGKHATNGTYQHLYWDGHQWNGWFNKGGPFASEPAVVNIGENNLNIFGVDADGKLKIQVWDGAQWLPSVDTYNQLGDTAVKASASGNVKVSDVFEHVADVSERVREKAGTYVKIELRV